MTTAHAQMDHVKAFNSKLMLSDVLHERTIQHKHKEKKLAFEREQEAEWLKTQQAAMDAFDEATKSRLIEDFKRREDAAKLVNEQLREAKLRAIERF